MLAMEKHKEKTLLFAAANKVKLKNELSPGDRLSLCCEIIGIKGYYMGVGKEIESVDGNIVCETEILFAIG
ncbi:3-hydroxyacyl-[acyl-carrier-protein] dehydratase FabZ [Clostridium puniceum]|uniref:3-hydroxyacyl-[acyl-carrier-protein] dehydratase FabZ n=1 Tax=Clostridium puniceum TaxID=29367 RepID=A0A1S8SWW5_9CLOT|nr:3-hydroxyacyl-[acyl-carrier-protein] dehydratase FabZ [Clostridium puniceum]